MSSISSAASSDRRRFLKLAAALGFSCAWATASPARRSLLAPRERRDLYPQGVASGDPDSSSVLLWTRRPFARGSQGRLTVEVAEDDAFSRVIATADARVVAASDWTCRTLIGNLEPASVYWYRFIDGEGHASRTGRTLTAPALDDPRPVKFAFVSCQNANMGYLHAYRRMILEDERAPAEERLGFVLHLGDYVYECVWYPEDDPEGLHRGLADQRIRKVIRYPNGERIHHAGFTFRVPTTLADYRTLYRAYYEDPDLQDARARWPFVCMWDNHEFSWSGWQSFQLFDGRNRPAQKLKVAANQAWFEYQPARVLFDPPAVSNAPITRFDAAGFGDEPNNRAAVDSLKSYRTLRWGRNLDLILTDERSYRSETPSSMSATDAFKSADFPRMLPEEVVEILDAGCAYANGKPPATLRFGDRDIPNFRKDSPPQTILGTEQKRWFLQQLESSTARWKVWGSSLGTLEARIDPQNLPAGLTKPWPGAGYAVMPHIDHSAAYVERAEIYTHIREKGITGFVTVCGDRHGFWAGLAAPALPPRAFEPCGVVFVTGAICDPYLAPSLPADHPLRGFYPIINLLIRHGVRSCLEYQRTGDLEKARRVSNPDLSPHLTFLDRSANGYSIVHASSDTLDCEFVCIPRPIERVTAPDGGPLLYRVAHQARLWKPGERVQLEQRSHPTTSPPT